MKVIRNFLNIVWLSIFLAVVSQGIVLVAQDTVQISYPDSLFRSYGYEGTFLLYTLNENTFKVYNDKRSRTGFLPASTFKIFNSMAALDMGAVRDENEIVKWDSIPRRIKNWNQDHSLRAAFQYSTVWMYQKFARFIGENAMMRMIQREQFGNQNILGGIDRFWLDGALKITAYQQIDFLRKLYAGTLGFTKRAQDICKSIMINDSTDIYVLRAKTGWADANDENVGWWVGYVETRGDVFFFALNIGYNGVAPDNFLSARKEIVRAILKKEKILPR